jgi:polysaccharide biosynthesis transport protein
MNSQSSTIVGNPPPAAVAAVPGQPAIGGLDFRDLLRVVIERRLIILGAVVLGLVLGIVATFLMTPRYSGTAVLELNSEASEVIDQARGNAQARRVSGMELLGTTVGLLRSEPLARRVAEDLNLASVPAYGGVDGTRQQRMARAVQMVRSGTNVEPVEASLLVQISHSSPEPRYAADVANALAKGFIASSLERRYESSSYARTFLSDQLARTKAALEQSERDLSNYAINARLFRMPGEDVDGQRTEGATLAAEGLAAMNKALNEATVERISAEQTFRNARLDTEGDTAARELVQQRATLQAEYEQKAKLFKPDYPQMQQLSAQIARLDAAIGNARGQASSSKRAQLEGAYRAAAQTEAQLAAQVANAREQVQSEEGRSIQYTILKREADTNRALYDALLQRYKEIGVAGGVGQSNVSLVDEAEPPQGPYSPNLILNAGAGLVLGLALGVALAFAVHLLFDTIVTPNDVRQKLHLPVLGVVPMESDGRSLVEALADRKSEVSEAYYSLRTALKFSRPEGAPRSLLITSTRPGEGKSTSAYAIASTFARLNSRVLLIDADLRKPSFLSSREDGYGLAHLLGTEEPLANYTEQTEVPNLDLLPVGRYVGSAAELLSSNRLPVIINEAVGNYEMVVIDAPPVLGLTDAPLLGSVAEATAIVVESRGSRTSSVTEMIRRLSDSGSNLVGVILTKIARSGAGYGYEYYSYAYGGNSETGGRVSSDPDRVLDLNRAET